jgi:hypothetical protein
MTNERIQTDSILQSQTAQRPKEDLGKDGMSMLRQNRLDHLYHKVKNNNSNNEIGNSYTI